RRRGPDSFELLAEFSTPLGYHPARIPLCEVKRLKSVYRVNAHGDLRGLSVDANMVPRALLLRQFLRSTFTVHLAGDIDRGRFSPALRVASQPGESRKLQLPEVAAGSGSSVLLPFHPANRLRGLRPGQSWRLSYIDPLNDSVGAFRNLFVAGPRR